MKYLQHFLRYLAYFWRAKTKYDIHSPFVFDYIENVLEDARHYYSFDLLEKLRGQLKKQKRSIQVTDYGAGSQVDGKKERTISSIAKSAVSPAKEGRLLFKTVHYFKPKTMLELGTSLGITTLYQYMANTQVQFITMEGCPQIAGVAKYNFDFVKAKNIEIVVGRFEDHLTATLAKFDRLDYIFFDGNHRKQATIDYFLAALPKAHSDSIFIFDDIHWSVEMEEAWDVIKSNDRVTLSLDLFDFGIVFFKKDFQEKQHFTLIDTWLKPWHLGFFK